MESFAAHGLADIATHVPVTDDTAFRVGSVIKTVTAAAILRLCEHGLVELDAPANDYLRAYRLVPARSGMRPATVRHLLTHTAGIREVLHPSGLLRMRDLGETVPAGRPVPALAGYYRGGLRVDAEPGSRWMYTNHGFATLGQIVADVTGQPLDRYVREQILDPLGMDRSDLVRSGRVRPGLATGYELRSRGAVPVGDYELITAGAGGLYTTARDLGRYLAALLGGGANRYGRILRPDTIAGMFAPRYRPDPRLPGMGLAFPRGDLDGRPVVEHDGILPGFDAQILLAPDDGVAVLALASGARRGMHWLAPEAADLLRRVLDLPRDGARVDVPHHPEVWAALCGWYRLDAYRTDPARLAIGAGAEVLIRNGRPVMRFLSPVPALCRGFPLRPGDPADPYVFRIDLPWSGVDNGRVVFGRDQAGNVTTLYIDPGPLSLPRRPAATNPRLWGAAIAVSGAAAVTAATLRRSRGRGRFSPPG